MNWYVTFGAVAGMTLASGCARNESLVPARASDLSPAVHEEHSVPSRNDVAGIRWTPPSRWIAASPRPMRVAMYEVPDPRDSAESAECCVFYFGKDEGGSPEENVVRWERQFENASSAQTTRLTVNSMPVTRVGISGTYRAPSGPMMDPGERHPGYRLLGAIVDAPEGEVFFRFTGPDGVIRSCESEFDSLISSIRD